MRKLEVLVSVCLCSCVMFLVSCLKGSDNGSGLASVEFKELAGCVENQCNYVSLKVTRQNDGKVLIPEETKDVKLGADGVLNQEDSPYLFTLQYYPKIGDKASYANDKPYPVKFDESKDGVLEVTIPVTKQNSSIQGADKLEGKSQTVTKTTVTGRIVASRFDTCTQYGTTSDGLTLYRCDESTDLSGCKQTSDKNTTQVVNQCSKIKEAKANFGLGSDGKLYLCTSQSSYLYQCN